MCNVDDPLFFLTFSTPFFRALSVPEMLVQFETAMKEMGDAASRVELCSTGRVLLGWGKLLGKEWTTASHSFQTL